MEEHLGSDGSADGYVADAQTMYNLSKDWYRGRMDADWSPPAADELETMFAKHGLTGDFWSLS